MEYIVFITEASRRLAQIEEKIIGAPSSAHIFCRLDVGIMLKNGKAHYFINEVERTLATCLWSAVAGVPLAKFSQATGFALSNRIKATCEREICSDSTPITDGPSCSNCSYIRSKHPRNLYQIADCLCGVRVDDREKATPDVIRCRTAGCETQWVDLTHPHEYRLD